MVLPQDHVRAAFPEHSFLGEESVDPGAVASAAALKSALQDNEGFMWVVSGFGVPAPHSPYGRLNGGLGVRRWTRSMEPPTSPTAAR